MLLNVFVVLCVAQSYVLLSALVINVVQCVAQSCVAQSARSLLLLNVFVILCVAQRVCYLMYYLVCSSLMSLYVLLIPYVLLNALGINIAQCANVFNGLVVLCVA